MATLSGEGTSTVSRIAGRAGPTGRRPARGSHRGSGAPPRWADLRGRRGASPRTASPARPGHSSPHPIVTTVSTDSSMSRVHLRGVADSMSMPTSAMASTATVGLTASRPGAEPAENTLDSIAAEFAEEPSCHLAPACIVDAQEQDGETTRRSVVTFVPRVRLEAGPGPGLGLGEQQPDQADRDRRSDQLHQDHQRGGRRLDAGEGVGQGPADGHRRVGETRGGHEEVRAPDPHSDGHSGELGLASTDAAVDHQEQPDRSPTPPTPQMRRVPSVRCRDMLDRQGNSNITLAIATPRHAPMHLHSDVRPQRRGWGSPCWPTQRRSPQG